MTPSMVEGLKRLQSNATVTDSGNAKSTITVEEDEPDLGAPEIAKPISHRQVFQLWKALKKLSDIETQGNSLSLEALLVGASVYVPPPPPKAEPSPEYKALMARLRRDEEARAYDRMVNPPDAYETSSFAQVNRPAYAADTGDDGVTLSDVNRQVMLIVNFVVTMAGVAYALWMLARWWPTPSRLFLAMSGSIAVGIVEYALYAGYVWHLSEAAKRDKAAPKEVREVVSTWTVGLDGGADGCADKERTEKGTKDETRKAGDGGVLMPDAPGASGIDSAQARRRKTDGTS